MSSTTAAAPAARAGEGSMTFHSLYAHGFARVAACTADVHVADPSRNAHSILEVGRRCSEQGVAVALFPELSLSGYALDDLLGGRQHPGRRSGATTAGDQTDKVMIGVSGGLDSTHALIVAARAMDLLGLPRSNILGFTMPGFATGSASKSYGWALMTALGVSGAESTSGRRQPRCSLTSTTPSDAARKCMTSRSRMLRRAFERTICSGSPITIAASFLVPGISRNWPSAGTPMVSGIRCRMTTSTVAYRKP